MFDFGLRGRSARSVPERSLGLPQSRHYIGVHSITNHRCRFGVDLILIHDTAQHHGVQLANKVWKNSRCFGDERSYGACRRQRARDVGNCRRNSPQPKSRMARLGPDLALTLSPGAYRVPAGERDVLLAFTRLGVACLLFPCHMPDEDTRASCVHAFSPPPQHAMRTLRSCHATLCRTHPLPRQGSFVTRRAGREHCAPPEAPWLYGT